MIETKQISAINSYQDDRYFFPLSSGCLPEKHSERNNHFRKRAIKPIPIWIIREFKTRSEEHTSELQSRGQLVCRLLLEKKNNSMKSDHIRPTHRPSIFT